MPMTGGTWGRKVDFSKTSYVSSQKLSLYTGLNRRLCGIFLRMLDNDGIIGIWARGTSTYISYEILDKDKFIDMVNKFVIGKLDNKFSKFKSNLYRGVIHGGNVSES